MNRYIPANAETRDYPAAAVIAYCYQSDRGPAFIAYKGRQSKLAHFLSFQSETRRDEYLATYIHRETEIETYKHARRETGHGLAVGDIVYSVWGYEQTNVEFFEVVRVPSGRSAVVLQIEGDTTEDSPGSMTGWTTPRPGQFQAGAKEQTRRVSGLHSLNGGKSTRGDLQKWDGTPRRVTWYG